MKTKFEFDPVSGTMQPVKEGAPLPVDTPVVAGGEKELPLEAPRVNVDTGENIVQFREKRDYTIFQVSDERTGKALMGIGGYALSIKFNMAELRNVQKVEQCLQGLTKLFRKLIIDQAVEGG